jgi:phosphoglycolate phosphatase-like HAD superfamily hydrolase
MTRTDATPAATPAAPPAALAATVRDAQDADRRARAMLDVFQDEIDREYPEPGPGDDDAWERWNEAYEDTYAERGGYDLEGTQRDAEDALLHAVRAYLSAIAAPGEQRDAIDTAYGAALFERYAAGTSSYGTCARARIRALDLCRRLDTTV